MKKLHADRMSSIPACFIWLVGLYTLAGDEGESRRDSPTKTATPRSHFLMSLRFASAKALPI